MTIIVDAVHHGPKSVGEQFITLYCIQWFPKGILKLNLRQDAKVNCLQASEYGFSEMLPPERNLMPFVVPRKENREWMCPFPDFLGHECLSLKIQCQIWQHILVTMQIPVWHRFSTCFFLKCQNLLWLSANKALFFVTAFTNISGGLFPKELH